MAFALLLGTLLATAGFLVVSIQGFAVPSDLAGASSAAKALVTRHISWAIPTVIFSLFSQSMVIFFFIGTGKLVKDEISGLPEGQRRRVLATLSRFKRETSPPATFALLSAIAVFVLGGAAHTKALPSWVHLASAAAAFVLHLWALRAEWRAFGENARLMSDPRGYARSLEPGL
ncbi:MAG: hypothetical protein ABR576_08790 [Thermoanaerobaculia bacterium]